MSGLFRFFRAEGKDTKPSGRIDSFEIVTLNISGMRYVNEYEIVMKEGKAEVSCYGIRFGKDEDRRVPEKRAERDEREVLDLLNSCRLLSWDGFHGKHPKGVSDGTMFTLKATVNGSIKIYADGSQNFPKHYRDLTDGIHRFLNGDA